MYLYLLVLFALTTSAKADGLSLNQNVVLTTPTAIEVVGLSPDSDEFKQLCPILQGEIENWSVLTQATPPCRVVSEPSTQLEGYGTLVQIDNDPVRDRYALTIRALDRPDSLEPRAVGWYVVKKQFDTEIVLRKLLRSYERFQQEKAQSKKRMLEYAVNRPIHDQRFAEEYEKFTHEPANARFIAAGLELVVALGVAASNYYSKPPELNKNQVDWDYRSGLRSRFDGSAYRFDSNGFGVNWSHVGAGFVYTTIARTSGLSRLQAYLFSHAGSALWECCIEYREVFSLNDTVITAHAGFIVGEAFFQISKILKKHRSDNLAWRAAHSVFASPGRASAWIENTATRRKMDFSDLSDDERDFWSKLEIYGVNEHFVEGSARGWGMSGTVINIPSFDRPGHVSATYLNKDTVEANLEIESASGEKVAFTRLMAKIVLSAIYMKNLGLDERERLQGYQLYIGPSMGVELRQKEIDGHKREGTADFSSIVHVLGGSASVTGWFKGTRFKFDLDVFGDFAMIHSPSFDAATHNGRALPGYGDYFKNCAGNIQTVLCNSGYYYGYGETARVGVSFRHGRLEGGANISASTYNIINGRSRHLETAAKLDARELLSSARTWVAYSITKWAKVEVGMEKTEHRSSYGDPNGLSARRSLKDTIKYVRLNWVLDPGTSGR